MYSRTKKKIKVNTVSGSLRSVPCSLPDILKLFHSFSGHWISSSDCTTKGVYLKLKRVRTFTCDKEPFERKPSNKMVIEKENSLPPSFTLDNSKRIHGL